MAPEQWRRDAADAAALRRAFAAAVEAHQKTGPMPEAVKAVWAQLYAAVTQHDAGLLPLAELERLRAENERLGAGANPWAAPN